MATPFDLGTPAGPRRTLHLVLGDQLDHRSPLLERIDPRHDAVLMMEVGRESTDPPSHVQRTVMFLAALRHHALWLHSRGLPVHYVRLDDPSNTQHFSAEIVRAVERSRCEALVVTEPGDHRVRQEIEAAVRQTGIRLEVYDDPHFLTTPAEFAVWAKGRKQLTMEYFYREQRRRLGVLMEGDQPAGGSWNFDADNRESFTTAPHPRPPLAFPPDPVTREVAELVARQLPDLPGRFDGFGWPVTRRDALAALDDFVTHRLVSFGTYEDAMWSGQRTLYHSRLSAALNLHLLSPAEVVDSALGVYTAGAAPLPAVEGFVRQIIGWREFIRGVYFLEGPEYADGNGLNAHGVLPEFYWTGTTDLACMADTVGSVVESGYAHHIPRLMVMGNLALLAGVRPRLVSDWFLGMFVDGVDWVTAPNVIGMALHADGGVVGTKPYAASGKYIQRMSNYCDRCSYSVTDRTGENACPFNTLYWDFLIRHREGFRGNHRMAMMLKNVDRLGEAERVAITVSAASVRRKLGVSPA
jgi:deoxyribodipyrimidine photolyase-related protein